MGVKDHNELTLEQRIQRLEISNLYRSVTLRLIQIYDEQAQGKREALGDPEKRRRRRDNSRGAPPRLIRFRDAPGYLGMDKNRFNAEVRPHLTEIPIGKQGRAFDKLDLDEWANQYKTRNGRPGTQKGENRPWDERKSPVSSTGRASGTSTRLSEEDAFVKALAKVKLSGRKSS